jgi:hypothetical protein
MSSTPTDFEEKEYFELEDEHIHVGRKRTTVEKELRKHKVQAHEIVIHLPETPELPLVEAYIPQTLSNAIFCGHVVTDLDSIAGAIGAAELYGGMPARASEVNSETAFALKLWGVDKPQPIEQLLVDYPKAGVCLVDHQQTSQLNKAIDVRETHFFSVVFIYFDIFLFVSLSFRHFRSIVLLESLIITPSKTPPLSRICPSISISALGVP